MNYNSFYNKPTLNNKELIGDNKASDIGGMTEEDMQELLETDLTSYYSKDEIDDLFSRSFVYREKSGSIVTFDCPSTSQSIPEVTVGIEPVQSGSGDPSPTNIRPISGWSAVNVYDGPTTDPQDATVYTIDLDGTRYGGTLDVVSGTLVVDRVAKVFDGSEDWSPNGNKGVFIRTSNIPNIETSKTFITDVYKTVPNGEAPPDGCINYNLARNAIQIHDERAMTSEAYKTLLQTNPVQLVYELATPQTIQLTPTAVKSRLGTNNLWADTGDVNVKCLDRIIPTGE